MLVRKSDAGTLQVVLASGRIVNANLTSYPDLFAALKGGSSNFGIVTSFDLKVFKQGKVCVSRSNDFKEFSLPSQASCVHALRRLSTQYPSKCYADAASLVLGRFRWPRYRYKVPSISVFRGFRQKLDL